MFQSYKLDKTKYNQVKNKLIKLIHNNKYIKVCDKNKNYFTSNDIIKQNYYTDTDIIYIEPKSKRDIYLMKNKTQQKKPLFLKNKTMKKKQYI